MPKATDVSVANFRRELLRALRGRRSAAQMSKLLGFNSNQYSRWENGTIRLPLNDLAQIAAATGRDFVALSREALLLSPSSTDLTLILREFLHGRSHAEIARGAGVSRTTVTKWLSGKGTIYADQFFRLILDSEYSIVRFARAFVPISALPSISKYLALEESEKALHFEHPWLAALVRCFETVEYERLPRHELGYFSRRTGLGPEEVKRGIAILQRAELITQNRSGGKFTPASKQLLTKGTFQNEKKIRLYWMRQAEKFLATASQRPERSQFGYRVFSCHPKAWELMKKAYLNFYRELDAISSRFPVGADRIGFLSLQLIDLEEMADAIAHERGNP